MTGPATPPSHGFETAERLFVGARFWANRANDRMALCLTRATSDAVARGEIHNADRSRSHEMPLGEEPLPSVLTQHHR
jgi:hypothetical protein